jgi:adenosylcobyric acid synthase
MSNNAAVTADGGEIGRAQALQARACGIPLVTDMNPVLLKPQSESGVQIVLDGKVWGTACAGEYRQLAPGLLPAVLAAFTRIAKAADLVLVEGAGSPAEINLRNGDIANMGFAEAADVPVVLIGDIERGGVIAQLIGTRELLSASEKALLTGYIVNKFRGDIRLFDGAISALRERTGLHCFGVVPYFPAAANLPAEDCLALTPNPRVAPSPRARGEGRGEGPLRIAVPLLPRIANFDDLDPLRAEPGVELVIVRPGQPLPRNAALVILPGSKATICDLEFLRREEWDIDLLAYRRQGGHILGICGGYQMLGQSITDYFGIEGRKQTVAGLGLLEVDTILGGVKRLVETAGVDLATGMPVKGYEMHFGDSTGAELERPMLRLTAGFDGCVSRDGRVAGCYLHGLFASDPFRRAFLKGLGADAGELAYEQQIEATLDALAEHVEENLDLSALLAAARPPRLKPGA